MELRLIMRLLNIFFHNGNQNSTFFKNISVVTGNNLVYFFPSQISFISQHITKRGKNKERKFPCSVFTTFDFQD